jgi:hypothetical protein
MSRYQLNNPKEVNRDDELLSTVPSADCPVCHWERPPKTPDLSPILEEPSTPVGQMNVHGRVGQAEDAVGYSRPG